MTHLTKADYITILTHYGKRIPKGKTRATLKRIKGATNRLIASKLCRCVKKVSRSGKNTNPRRLQFLFVLRLFSNEGGLNSRGDLLVKKSSF